MEYLGEILLVLFVYLSIHLFVYLFYSFIYLCLLSYPLIHALIRDFFIFHQFCIKIFDKAIYMYVICKHICTLEVKDHKQNSPLELLIVNPY